MIKANKKDKDLIMRILTNAFQDNKSVNYIVKQDRHRIKRISRLMAYSFEYCRLFGEVYLSENRQACALLMYPHRKSTTLRSMILDMQLAVSCVGVTNIGKVLKREAVVKQLHTGIEMCYLWFIGVSPDAQHQGLGSTLLKEIIEQCDTAGMPVYLETSVQQNVPWYEKFGFGIYKELDLGYQVICMRK